MWIHPFRWQRFGSTDRDQNGFVGTKTLIVRNCDKNWWYYWLNRHTWPALERAYWFHGKLRYTCFGQDVREGKLQVYTDFEQDCHPSGGVEDNRHGVCEFMESDAIKSLAASLDPLDVIGEPEDSYYSSFTVTQDGKMHRLVPVED